MRLCLLDVDCIKGHLIRFQSLGIMMSIESFRKEKDLLVWKIADSVNTIKHLYSGKNQNDEMDAKFFGWESEWLLELLKEFENLYARNHHYLLPEEVFYGKRLIDEAMKFLESAPDHLTRRIVPVVNQTRPQHANEIPAQVVQIVECNTEILCHAIVKERLSCCHASTPECYVVESNAEELKFVPRMFKSVALATHVTVLQSSTVESNIEQHVVQKVVRKMAKKRDAGVFRVAAQSSQSTKFIHERDCCEFEDLTFPFTSKLFEFYVPVSFANCIEVAFGFSFCND